MPPRQKAAVLGRPPAEVLPLEDLEGRRWWQLTDPYGGLDIRTLQPERNLLLPGAARFRRAPSRYRVVRLGA